MPNASEDLPEPDTPVKTTRASRGIATSTSFRLCSRAPRTRTNPSRAGVTAWGGSRFVMRQGPVSPPVLPQTLPVVKLASSEASST